MAVFAWVASYTVSLFKRQHTKLATSAGEGCCGLQYEQELLLVTVVVALLGINSFTAINVKKLLINIG